MVNKPSKFYESVIRIIGLRISYAGFPEKQPKAVSGPVPFDLYLGLLDLYLLGKAELYAIGVVCLLACYGRPAQRNRAFMLYFANVFYLLSASLYVSKRGAY